MPYFTFTDASNETFVVRLTDPALIAHARRLLAGATDADPRIGGVVVKAPADYNIGWSYQLAPDSIFFFEMAAEVGDSTMRYIERHLGAVGGELLPGRVWTGWSSTLTGELAAQAGGAGSDCLTGTARADLLMGRTGSDVLAGGRGDDHLAGGAGSDWARGGGGHDKLGGGGGADLLHGGGGRDLLVGDGGSDALLGGAGADIFQFGPAGESGIDVVLDLDLDGGDRLRIDASWLRALGDVNGDGRTDRADLAAAFVERDGLWVLRFDSDTQVVLHGASGEILLAQHILIG